MPETRPRKPVVRFGVFEADLEAGELRKGGRKVKLQEQPFQVLASLLERPGEVITREGLRDRLWPDGTFVDFDHSLNTAINKVREALGDSAENPRFVETLPRRGYRFIAEVKGVGASVSRQSTQRDGAEAATSISRSATSSDRNEVTLRRFCKKNRKGSRCFLGGDETKHKETEHDPEQEYSTEVR